MYGIHPYQAPEDFKDLTLRYGDRLEGADQETIPNFLLQGQGRIYIKIRETSPSPGTILLALVHS